MESMDAATASARRRTSIESSAKGLNVHLAEVLGDMEKLGIVTQLANKMVGGIAIAPAYYQHVMMTEGKADEVPTCHLLLAKMEEGGVVMIPAQKAQLEEGHPTLPRESPLLAKILSPAALTEVHWTRVPAVAIFGCFVADEDELQEAAAAGIPISPSMTGPHMEELMTQMEVFFKQYKYPDNKCFILRDWGFLIFGADLGDAIDSFNAQLKETLVVTSEAADKVPDQQDGSHQEAAGSKKIHGFLSRAFMRLQETVGMRRTQSLPSDQPVMADLAPVATKGPVEKLIAASEPSSPMVGTDLPDSLRSIGTLPHRTGSEAYRVPSFQTGFKPW